MIEPFEVVDVSDWRFVESEPLGRNAKQWLRAPGGTSDRLNDWLFKPVVTPPSTGVQQGEDWAEKLVTELGAMLGAPCAEVRLAVQHGVPGSISRNIVPAGWTLILGSELLAAVVPGYRSTAVDATGNERRIPGRPGYSLPNIARVLAHVGRSERSPGVSALEAFARYLVLDAWAGNQDRHEQNWAALRAAVGPADLRLAPSFDHASSLGFSLTDESRAHLLREGRVRRWAERGRAHRFEHDPTNKAGILSLVDFAGAGLSMAGEEIAGQILGQVSAIEMSDVEVLVSRVPNMSDVTATFVVELLAVNRGRLLE